MNRQTFMDEAWDSDLGFIREKSEDIGEVLKGVPIFESFDEEEIEQIRRIVHGRVFLPKEVIVHQGAPGVGMYIVQSGSADVVLEVDEGSEIKLTSLGEGQFFGEMSLLDGAPRAASVVATERSKMIGFFRADLMDLISQSPQLGLKIVYFLSQMMCERLGETVQEYRDVLKAIRSLEKDHSE